MGTDQNTRAYRRRLNVVANNFRRKSATEAQPETREPPVAVKIIARTLMWIRVQWPAVLLIAWLAVVAAIGVLSHC